MKEAETVFEKIVILYASRDDSGLERGDLLLGSCVLALIVLAIFLAGRWLKAVIGPIVLNILMRVMGLMVAAMGAQFLITGINQNVLTQLVPALR